MDTASQIWYFMLKYLETVEVINFNVIPAI